MSLHHVAEYASVVSAAVQLPQLKVLTLYTDCTTLSEGVQQMVEAVPSFRLRPLAALHLTG